MATPVLDSEPLNFTAGDTVKWRKRLSDYPATTWTLSYYLVKSSDYITFDAANDSGAHLVTIPATTSAGYGAGVYSYQSKVTDGSETLTIGVGKIEVLPAFASQSDGYDNRSFAKKMLDILEPLFITMASKGHASYEIGGRSMTYHSKKDLRDDYNHWKSIYNAEERKAGRKSGSIIRVRFN